MGLLVCELSFIQKLYPEYSERIEDLYKSDADFKTLCADYLLCKSSMDEFQKQHKEQQNAIQDYEAVSNELEKELFEFLLR
jgi:hypothetical protein